MSILALNLVVNFDNFVVRSQTERKAWNRSSDKLSLGTRLQVRGLKRLGCHADLCTASRCRTRGESQEFIACRWQSMQARDPPWLWNPGQTSPEVQNIAISVPTKRTDVLQNFLKKKKIKKTFLRKVSYILYSAPYVIKGYKSFQERRYHKNIFTLKLLLNVAQYLAERTTLFYRWHFDICKHFYLMSMRRN